MRVILVVHPLQFRDIQADPTFEPASTYSEFIPLLGGEVGRVKLYKDRWVRIVLSTYPAGSAVGS